MRAVEAWWQRPVSWGAVFLSYIGIIGAAAYGAATLRIESNHRQTQICQVIENVHKNAQVQARADRRRINGIEEYLKDPLVPRDGLYSRIKETLPRAREDYEVSRAAVTGTVPPSSCRG